MDNILIFTGIRLMDKTQYMDDIFREELLDMLSPYESYVYDDTIIEDFGKYKLYTIPDPDYEIKMKVLIGEKCGYVISHPNNNNIMIECDDIVNYPSLKGGASYFCSQLATLRKALAVVPTAKILIPNFLLVKDILTWLS